MQLIPTQPDILSVLLYSEEDMINPCNDNKMIHLLGFELVAYQIKVSNMAVNPFGLFLSRNL